MMTPLRRMEIRFDGLQAAGGLRTVNGARFGMTRNNGTRPHQGVDLYAAPGTPVFAVAEGKIAQVRHAHASYGRDIVLRFSLPKSWCAYLARAGSADSDGIVFAQYAHLGAIYVEAGQSVSAGQVIGITGITGNSDQRYPHLHFELRKVISPGTGLQGLKNRINPELMFGGIDYSRAVEAIDLIGRTV